MSHRGVEMQLFDKYCCLSTSFSRTPESSAVSFFSPCRSFWGTALCRDWTWSDPPERAWRHFLFGSFGWRVSDSFLRLSLCRVGSARLVPPPPFPARHHSLHSDFQHLFTHSLLIQCLLNPFSVSLLDLIETLKNKTQHLLSRSPHFRGNKKVFTDWRDTAVILSWRN